MPFRHGRSSFVGLQNHGPRVGRADQGGSALGAVGKRERRVGRAHAPTDRSGPGSAQGCLASLQVGLCPLVVTTMARRRTPVPRRRVGGFTRKVSHGTPPCSPSKPASGWWMLTVSPAQRLARGWALAQRSPGSCPDHGRQGSCGHFEMLLVLRELDMLVMRLDAVQVKLDHIPKPMTTDTTILRTPGATR